VVEMKMICMSGGTLEIYLEPDRPAPQLLLIGHLPVVETLSLLGKAMQYKVTVMGMDIDPARFSAADRVVQELDFSQVEINRDTYVVVASHGNYDESALEVALPSPAMYVALVASRKRAESIYAYLGDAGLPEKAMGRLKVPAGLDIGASDPQEIALSIMAEIVQVRRLGYAPQFHFDIWKEEQAPAEPAPETALDPVCEMTVEVSSARYTASHRGQTYYFCSAHCQHAFEKQPEQYLKIQDDAPAAGEAAHASHH
ncbi:MAG: XdhC family protein, partial [Anaerolineaceae bacterium]|nr:XdhC family protein [Anaerolineaceae bacterium]